MKPAGFTAKIVMATAALLLAAALIVAGTFAWITRSQTPEMKEIKVSVSDSNITEIALANSFNILEGPDEVTENDFEKEILVVKDGDGIRSYRSAGDGTASEASGEQTILKLRDQGGWGGTIVMNEESVISQNDELVAGCLLNQDPGDISKEEDYSLAESYNPFAICLQEPATVRINKAEQTEEAESGENPEETQPEPVLAQAPATLLSAGEETGAEQESSPEQTGENSGAAENSAESGSQETTPAADEAPDKNLYTIGYESDGRTSGNFVELSDPLEGLYEKVRNIRRDTGLTEYEQEEKIQALVEDTIGWNGIVYRTRIAGEKDENGNYTTNQNYRTPNGHVATATAENPVEVNCAGGPVFWLRSNQDVSKEIRLDQIPLLVNDTGEETDTADESASLGILVNIYHRTGTTEEDFDLIKEKSILLNSENYGTADNGYAFTVDMTAGDLYLVEVDCYMEGDRENSAGNNAVTSGNSGSSSQYEIGNVELSDLYTAAQIKETNGVKRYNGWYGQDINLHIELYGSSRDVVGENTEVTVYYRLEDLNGTEEEQEPAEKGTQEKTPENGWLSFPAFQEDGTKNSADLPLTDGMYQLTVYSDVRTYELDSAGKKILTGQKQYYTAAIGEATKVSKTEDSITVRVDTVKPDLVLSYREKLEDGSTPVLEPRLVENGRSYFDGPVVVRAETAEENLASIRVGGKRLEIKTCEEEVPVEGGTVSLTRSYGERTYLSDGDYSVKSVIADRAGNVNDTYSKEEGREQERADTAYFTVDTKAPEFSEPQWGFVNDDAAAGILNRLTGRNFFGKKIMVSITAADAHIDSLTCSALGGSAVKTDAVDTGSTGRAQLTATLDEDFSDRLVFTAADKSGNEKIFTTEEISVVRAEDISGLTVAADISGDHYIGEDGKQHYMNATWHLSSDYKGPASVTGYEYSFDQKTWYSDSRTLEGVVYTVAEDTELSCDTLTVSCENNKATAEVSLYFRAVTNVIESVTLSGKTEVKKSDSSSLYQCSLFNRRPATPTVTAEVDGEPYTSEMLLKGGTVVYTLEIPETEDLVTEGFEFSTDREAWYDCNVVYDSGSDWTVNQKNLTLSLTATEGKEIHTRVYFRSRAHHKDFTEVVTVSEPTEAYECGMDQQAPVLSEISWREVNEDTGSGILRSLTRNLFFHTMIEVSVKASDENLASLVCVESESQKTTEEEKELQLKVYLEPDYSDSLTFVATDRAGNTSRKVTEIGLQEKYAFTVSVTCEEEPYLPGTATNKTIEYRLTPTEEIASGIDHFEYQIEMASGGTQWKTGWETQSWSYNGMFISSGKETIKGDVLSLSVPEDRQMTGNILFRAVYTEGEVTGTVEESQTHVFSLDSTPPVCLHKAYTSKTQTSPVTVDDGEALYLTEAIRLRFEVEESNLAAATAEGEELEFEQKDGYAYVYADLPLGYRGKLSLVLTDQSGNSCTVQTQYIDLSEDNRILITGYVNGEEIPDTRTTGNEEFTVSGTDQILYTFSLPDEETMEVSSFAYSCMGSAAATEEQTLECYLTSNARRGFVNFCLQENQLTLSLEEGSDSAEAYITVTAYVKREGGEEGKIVSEYNRFYLTGASGSGG